MATTGGLRSARGALMLTVLAAAGLAGCSGGEPKTTTAATGTAATMPSSTATTTAPCTFSGAADPTKGGADLPTRLLTDVRVGAHGCYDRVTFEFKPQKGEPDGPVAWKAAYRSPPITEDGSGRRVQVKGNAFLVVTMTAAGVDLSAEGAPESYTGPTSMEAADTTRIRQVRRTGDFEAVLTWVIGLDKQRPFRVTAQGAPTRLLVDVGD